LQFLDNAPFAINDSVKVTGQFTLVTLLANDYDYETLQKNLILKVVKITGTGTTDSVSWFNFASGSADGSVVSIQYRVGEKRATRGDTLWGNTAIAVLTKGNPTGITTVSNTNISLYPNPAADYITITGFEGIVNIYDLTGRLVLEQQTTGNGYLNVSSLKSGLYVAKVNDKSIKFIKK